MQCIGTMNMGISPAISIEKAGKYRPCLEKAEKNIISFSMLKKGKVMDTRL